MLIIEKEQFMNPRTVEYRGYQIVVTPIKDHDDLWDFTYQISKTGDPAAAILGHSVTRRQSLGGRATAATACDAGIELAKTEIDNRIALSEK
jgi:phage tail sheath gpL-like